ncbi:Rha family transcriptional regulator, partial [Lactobacillus intestinalis]
MENLVIMHDSQAVTTSLKVAESFRKAHRNVLASIKNFTAENSAVKNMFVESTYINRRGQEQPMFYMNRDGFSLLVMGFTGNKALQFKLQYIEAFNRMEQLIKEEALPQTPEEKLKLTMEAATHLDQRLSTVEDEITDMKENAE